jgi:hypothetical protein
MMGDLDAQGIYSYDDTEDVSPLMDYMNLGQSATSAAVAAVRGEIAAIDSLVDSDWLVIGSGPGTGAFGTGWTATVDHPPRLRKLGSRVDIAGALTLGPGALYTHMLTIPEGFRLIGAYTNYFIGASISADGIGHDLFLDAVDHFITVPEDGYRTGVALAGDHIPLHGFWYVD